MNKISTYLQNNFPNITGTEVLWPTVDDQDVKDYANKVLNSPANPAGDFGLLFYGNLDFDSYNIITSNDGKNYGLVGSQSEYYFTDMVFIQQKYEEAAFDLYLYRAEYACTPWRPDQGVQLRASIDEAIQDTFLIAEHNGFALNQQIFDQKIDSLLDDYFAERVNSFNENFQDRLPNISEYTDIFMRGFKDYYLDPSVETMDRFLQTAINMDDELTFEKTGRRDFWKQMVASLCGDNGFSIIMYVSANKDKFSYDMTPATQPLTLLSEASAKEMELVFKG